MKENKCKQGEASARACVQACALAVLCRMGTGGIPDSTGTGHPRIYHSPTVTAGQGTDVYVYPRATSDWPSLALAHTARRNEGREYEEGGIRSEKVVVREGEEKISRMVSLYLQGT